MQHDSRQIASRSGGRPWCCVDQILNNGPLIIDEVQEALKIRQEISALTATIRRAYYELRDELAEQAVENGEKFGKLRRRNSRAARTRAKVREMLRRELPVKQIAEEVGCSANTVCRVGQQLRPAGKNGLA